MIFSETKLRGSFVIEPEPISDHRGFFARIWSADEFRGHGLNPNLVECSISLNRSLGTIRGMHWQAAPHAEAKLVRCTRGRMRDVIVDLRPESATYLQWLAFELDADNRRMVYVPEGFAHGFETLEPDTEVQYQISAPYVPESARGFRWDDPSVGITWLSSPPVLSERDQAYPDYEDGTWSVPSFVQGPNRR